MLALNDKLKGHAAVLCTSLLSSINIPVSKYLIDSGYVNGYAVAQWRAVVACVVFWTISMIVPESRSKQIPMRDKGILLLGASFGMSFNLMMFLVGFSETSTIDASIIGSMIPVFTMVLAALLLREPISAKKTIGVALGLTGGLTIILSGNAGGIGTSTLWGAGLHTAAAMSYATYLIINRDIASKYHPITISKWMFLFASILLFPFCGNDLISAPLFTSSAPLSVWVAMLYVALGTSVVGYLLVPVSLKYIRPTTVSMYNYMQPLVAAGIAIYVGQDYLTMHKPLACILIFVGVYLVTTSRSKAERVGK